jgi:hypothetical protein
MLSLLVVAVVANLVAVLALVVIAQQHRLRFQQVVR